MIVYKIDIVEALKEKGYSYQVMQREKLFSGKVLNNLRNGKPISFENLDKICTILSCGVGDIITYIPDKEN